MATPIHIATRKSPLALKQTEMVLAWLQAKLPEDHFEELHLTTKVDERLSWSLEKRGGIGLFTKELEDALLDGRAQLAVHSAKDMPTAFQADLHVAGYMPRARATDVLVHRSDCPEPTAIATSSPRRRAQLGLIRDNAEWTTIRGNVGTRLRKITEGEADATLLAAAGLDRLDITAHEGLEFVELPIEQVVPAPGQAAIAIQCRAADLPKYEHLFCEQTKLAVELERAFLRKLGGGCQTPVGAHYTDGTFYIFHPETGHTSFEFELDSLDDIEPILESIFNDLQFNS
ncbi:MULTISPECIES: hydroxymethylbilane synthase [unclassified Lentimonas]|uniref:hydroxymethylbilane synthase n=1 Tax=unclassified Lentimonas TaxID=2630993 RepID=UPI00132AB574|nr:MULTISPECIES: hydroxymethylbilane synthase [unclassified Lentimonas]CAA6677950.1 Porphobilinogen deaminase (EC [Lentimonas sp. CC4]CAA6684054.1 Porphobilinogen deaminase (EC [Lentimonas sp. CC6]CAA7076570.1 Porphobilinogen deaminase (EC [Lentimonas sp. CC4]CAA7170101.1 Porphobilinogen deaminase (EC [Lentimonas sp. CC21]CAA7181386.1 Porphobilinogen deaminase (EC [Lentimonas sp. CC8]